MPVDPVSAGILAGGSVLQTVGQHYLNKSAAEQNQAYYRENMQANYLLSQQAQQNAARNEKIGLQRAGMSTVLADGAAGAPQVSAQGGTMQPAQLSNALLLSQIKNIEAQTAKTNAETDNERQKFGESQTRGNTYSLNLKNMFSKFADETTDKNDKAFWESMVKEAEEVGVFGTGAAEGYRNYVGLYAETYEARMRKLESNVRAIVAEGVYDKAAKKSDFFDKLVRMDEKQYDKIVAEIAKLGADKKNLEVLEKLNTEKINLTKEDQKRLQAMADQMRDYDIAGAIKRGDVSGTVAAFFGLLLQAIAGVPGHVSATGKI